MNEKRIEWFHLGRVYDNTWLFGIGFGRPHILILLLGRWVAMVGPHYYTKGDK